MCNGSLEGGVVGSSDIIFNPGPLEGGGGQRYIADTKTAGLEGVVTIATEVLLL